tara:strand:- start:1057 stop:1260 length:204 start_codon:yes stop_codon:yes gene_type:complete
MKSFNITRSIGLKPRPPFDFTFEWTVDENTKQFIPVSLHGAKALGEHFKSVGYENKTEIKDYKLNLL